METGEKARSHGKAPSRESGAKGKEESPPRVKSLRSGDKKKKMKNVVYYETDSSSSSTSGSDAASVTSKRHERKKYSKMPLRYPRISKRDPLLFVPLGKPPYFDGEDYCMWSDKMRHHLTSLHARIWDIVEFGAQVPTVGDPRYKLMSPKEVIGKFVSFELMIKGSKHIVDLEQGGTSTSEVQPVAFKATEEKKEESTSSRPPIDVSKLDNEEMALIIKIFHQILK
jgi:hypothetical protein